MSLLKIVHREKDGVKEPTRSFSKKQEDAVAKKFGGHRTLNSGATPFQKGDVSLNKLLLECKTKKNEKESLFMGKKYSALAFNFGPGQKNYYIIDEYLFQKLIEILDQEN